MLRIPITQGTDKSNNDPLTFIYLEFNISSIDKFFSYLQM